METDVQTGLQESRQKELHTQIATTDGQLAKLHVSALTSQASLNEATLLSLTKTMEKLVEALDKVGVNIDEDSVHEQEKDKQIQNSTTAKDDTSSSSSGDQDTQPERVKYTTMDTSDAMEDYKISPTYTQWRMVAEQWYLTRQARKKELKRASPNYG